MELIKQIKHLQLQCHMLVYSGNDETIYAKRVLAASAQGYLMKEGSPLNLLTAIRRVLASEIVVGKEIANQLLLRGSNHLTLIQKPLIYFCTATMTCHYKVSFGDGFICTCPVRNVLYDRYRI